MYTTYKHKGKNYQFHTASAYAMGKEAFCKAHAQIPRVGEAWAQVEANATSQKSEKAPKTKVDGPEKTK
jgi:hypothetical protein